MKLLEKLIKKPKILQRTIGLSSEQFQLLVSRILLAKMLPLIEQAADAELATYLARAKEEYAKIPKRERINNWADFLKKHPELRDISTDATEQTCYCSVN